MIITDIIHESHAHNLRREFSHVHFRCDGCKELGSGLRYRCEECNYDLHKDCALAPSSMSHPFFGKSHFEFIEKGKPERFCDACGKDVLGFVYHCPKYGYDLHPCCANLPHVLEGEGVKLRLHNSLSSKCGVCELKKLWGDVKGWTYRSSDGEWQFHVSCVKAMLIENRVPEKKCSDLDAEMRTLSSYDGGRKVSTNLQLKPQDGAIIQLKPEDGKVVSDSSSNKGKTSKWWKMVKTVLVLIITVIIGDPTALLASVLVNSIF